MRQKVKSMRDQLTTSLTEHFSHEISRSLQEIKDTITPYTRFVRSENEKNQEAHQKLKSYLTKIIQLSNEIESSK